jgi:hypothetical protein
MGRRMNILKFRISLDDEVVWNVEHAIILEQQTIEP